MVFVDGSHKRASCSKCNSDRPPTAYISCIKFLGFLHARKFMSVISREATKLCFNLSYSGQFGILLVFHVFFLPNNIFLSV